MDAFWSAFGGGFGRQNGAENRISGPLSTHLFLKHLSIDFLIDFGRLRTLKIAFPPAREHDFCKIRVFKKELKQVRFGGAFWQSKPLRIA